MSLALIALLCAVALWFLAIRRPSKRTHPSAERIEFWWTLSAFAAGMSFPALNIASVGSVGSSDLDVAIRLAPILAFGFIAVVRSLVTRARIPASGAWLLLAFGVLAAQSIQTPSPIVVLSFLLFLPAIVTPSRGYDLQAILDGSRVGITVGLVAIAGIAAINGPLVIGACRLDKCSMWGESLGPLGTGNALGLVVAASAAVSLLTTSSPVRFGVVVMSSYILVDLTSSRSALYSWIAAVGIALAYQLSKQTGRKFFVTTAAVAAGVVTASFTFLGWTGLDFTERGALWLYAQRLIEAQPWFGYGSSFWVRGGGTDGIQLNYSTHNLFLELLVSFGVVGVGAFVVAVVYACRAQCQLESRLFTTALAGVLCVMSITEVFSAPGRPYIMAAFVVFLFIAGASAQEPRSGSTRTGTQATADPADTALGRPSRTRRPRFLQ
ncbi:O-antigen ligase family protein [Microbacterium sp. SORGH_AS_0421]|uniref:O-antigen ligase family protein n=1 Tax=Microbacterium sp. SORGH_AS_0421 TaxID=3041768 RepID=UPI0027926E15|nr:O-antigen ligase family protein [Microbacterium sp. SORGH_AS_0421]MDQ1178222.1 hypothetical protein [Microbacterium sp. SORGH_AS_0421]